MIHGEAGRDLMAHGRVWIDVATGRVLKTELQVEQPAIRATVTTTFHLEDRSGIAVPLEMREQYTFANGNRVNTVAIYGRFRRFDVSATEDIQHAARAHRRRMDRHDAVELPPGRFTMGSSSSEIGRSDDEVLHDVEITRPFFIGQFEVTQQEWRTVMGTAPSQFGACGNRCPVENVTLLRRPAVPREAERARRAGAVEGAVAAVPAADRSGMGVRLPREHHRPVLDWRER